MINLVTDNDALRLVKHNQYGVGVLLDVTGLRALFDREYEVNFGSYTKRVKLKDLSFGVNVEKKSFRKMD